MVLLATLLLTTALGIIVNTATDEYAKSCTDKDGEMSSVCSAANNPVARTAFKIGTGLIINPIGGGIAVGKAIGKKAACSAAGTVLQTCGKAGGPVGSVCTAASMLLRTC